MASLDVNVIDMKDGKVTKIEHGGESYEKVDVNSAGDVKEGDIGLRVNTTDLSRSSVNLGKYYEIAKPVDVLGDLKVFYVGEKGAAVFTHDYKNFEYFRKTSPEIIFDKPAQVGDTIRIVERHFMSEDYYKNGDVMTVLSVGYDGDITETDKYDGLILSREFEIIGRAGEVASKKPIQVGDTVKLTIKEGERPRHGWGDVNNGDIGKVFRINSDGVIAVDFPNHDFFWSAREDELIVVDEGELPQLSEGDIAKVVGPTLWDDIKEGSYVKIDSDVDSDGDYRISMIDGADFDYATQSSLEKVDDDEDSWTFIKAGRNPGEPKVGDIVYGERSLKRGEFIYGEVKNEFDEIGDIGVISFVDGKYRSVEALKLIAAAENRADLS